MSCWIEKDPAIFDDSISDPKFSSAFDMLAATMRKIVSEDESDDGENSLLVCILLFLLFAFYFASISNAEASFLERKK